MTMTTYRKERRPPTPDELEAAIRLTNNGYLFTPSQHEIDVANQNPDRFVATTAHGGHFGRRVGLKR